MLRSVVPGLPEKMSALTSTWLDHPASQAPKVDHSGGHCCSKERHGWYCTPEEMGIKNSLD